MTSKEANEIRPVVLTDENGKRYTLEFDAESVKYAQERGFNSSEVDTKPMVVIPQLFRYAFRKNHKSVSTFVIDTIWKELTEDGMPEGLIERLMLLYIKPMECLMSKEEDDGKNSRVTVEL